MSQLQGELAGLQAEKAELEPRLAESAGARYLLKEVCHSLPLLVVGVFSSSLFFFGAL